MGILRNKIAENFVQIPSELISSPLSHGAVRVYCYLATKPDGWKVYNTDIKKQCRISDGHTIAKYLKQLVEAGWLERERAVNEKNQFDGTYDYELRLSPNRENSPIGEKPVLGKTPKHNNIKLPTNIKKESNNNTDYADAIVYLNAKAGTNYRPINGNLAKVKARLDEGYTLEDVKSVIDSKCTEWIGTKFEQYLRPETLFGATKFAGYVGQAGKVDNGDWADGRRPSEASNGNELSGEFF